ncbi:MAG: BatA domain-containing protein, partial [Thermoguttaceae bacterium]
APCVRRIFREERGERLMFGVNLIHAGFLAAAAAVSIPILIHLLLRPHPRQMPIGTLRFLRLAMKETKRRRKIRRWLLLAMRVAAVLLLALLFARPYLAAAVGGMGQDREIIVLIDQSGSMAAMYSGESLFACAQAAAENILAAVPQGAKVHLGYFDDRGVTPSPDARIDFQRQPGYAGTDFGQALCWAHDVFLTSSRQQRKLYLLTDLQRTGQRTPCKGFPANAEIEVVELGKPLMGNLAVEKAEVVQPTIRPQEPIVVTAHVSNAGVLPAHDVQVRLCLQGNGTKLADQSKTISIAPSSSQQVEFSALIDRPGLYQGFVEVVADDGFAVDNRRWLAFEARGADRILLVDGEPGSSVFGNETYYLEAALRLALPGKGSSLTPYEPVRWALEAGSRLPDLTSCGVVVLCNVAGLNSDDLARLQAFVVGGGRLLVFTGGKVEPASYAVLEQAGLLPGVVEGASPAGLFRLQTWEKDHPIFRPLSDPQQGDLRRVAFRRITRVKPSADAKVLATASGGQPLLLERTQGRGIVLLFASAADRDWGDWPQSRLYVPLVHQIIGYLTDRLPENQRVRCEIAGPGADKPPGVASENNVLLVRNVDARESRIERYSQKQFRDEFQLGEVKVGELPRQAVAAVLPPGVERPSELWTWVIWFLLAVLAIETFVANRTHA